MNNSKLLKKRSIGIQVSKQASNHQQTISILKQKLAQAEATIRQLQNPIPKPSISSTQKGDYGYSHKVFISKRHQQSQKFSEQAAASMITLHPQIFELPFNFQRPSKQEMNTGYQQYIHYTPSLPIYEPIQHPHLEIVKPTLKQTRRNRLNSAYQRPQDLPKSTKQVKNSTKRRKSCVTYQKGSLLDELLFTEKQRARWNSVKLSLKKNPKLLGQLIREEAVPIKPDLPKIQQKTDIVVDWSQSPLDSSNPDLHISQIITSDEIQQALQDLEQGSVSSTHSKQLFKRTVQSLNILKKQLCLPKNYIKIHPQTSLQFLLQQTKKLIRARALTSQVLRMIHQREDLLLQLMSEDKPSSAQCRRFLVLSSDLQQALTYWKHAGLPFTNFIYLGSDYSTNLQKDTQKVSQIFKSNRK